MNLNAYDEVKEKIDKSKTWINIKKHQLLSREIKYRQITTLGKRYCKNNNSYEYFIILLDDAPYDREYAITRLDDYGRIKVNLYSIWNECSLKSFDKDCNVSIKHIEHTDDGDIYQLDV